MAPDAILNAPPSVPVLPEKMQLTIRTGVSTVHDALMIRAVPEQFRNQMLERMVPAALRDDKWRARGQRSRWVCFKVP